MGDKTPGSQAQTNNRPPLSSHTSLLLRLDHQNQPQPSPRHTSDHKAPAMSVAFLALAALLSSSLVVAFVLHPAQQEPSASACVGRQISCHRQSLQSIRKALLAALNLQTEPQLPVGGLITIREQWMTTFSTIAHRAQENPGPKDVTPEAGNCAGLKCCPMASHISLTDLGWDNWVIYPESFTFVQCVSCNSPPNTNTVHCPPHDSVVQGNTEQGPCCLPTVNEIVPILYMDELSTLVISSVEMIRSCGCGLDQP